MTTITYLPAPASDVAIPAAYTATYTVNEPGARTWREAKPLYINGGAVTASTYPDGTAAVFVGTRMHFDGVLPDGICPGSAEFYAWCIEVATAGETERTALPPKPKAADYTNAADKSAWRRGLAAARRYMKGQGGYSEYIARADARDEPGAWYDAWDSILNPEYFAA
jgi:hypothetical protein